MSLFRRLFALVQPESAPDPERRRQLACAVLLLECARADFEQAASEQAALRTLLADHFGLDAAATEALLHEAGVEGREAVSLHHFLERINRELDLQGKRELLGLLWRVALADGRVDPREEHLLRRLADLLYLPHGVFIATRLQAEAGHG